MPFTVEIPAGERDPLLAAHIIKHELTGVLNWALEGHGILMRAEWDVAKYLRSGRLRQVLDNWQTPAADIHLIYPLPLEEMLLL